MKKEPVRTRRKDLEVTRRKTERKKSVKRAPVPVSRKEERSEKKEKPNTGQVYYVSLCESCNSVKGKTE